MLDPTQLRRPVASTLGTTRSWLGKKKKNALPVIGVEAKEGGPRREGVFAKDRGSLATPVTGIQSGVSGPDGHHQIVFMLPWMLPRADRKQQGLGL
jgi:hypothetical protein